MGKNIYKTTGAHHFIHISITTSSVQHLYILTADAWLITNTSFSISRIISHSFLLDVGMVLFISPNSDKLSEQSAKESSLVVKGNVNKCSNPMMSSKRVDGRGFSVVRTGCESCSFCKCRLDGRQI